MKGPRQPCVVFGALFFGGKNQNQGLYKEGQRLLTPINKGITQKQLHAVKTSSVWCCMYTSDVGFGQRWGLGRLWLQSTLVCLNIRFGSGMCRTFDDRFGHPMPWESWEGGVMDLMDFFSEMKCSWKLWMLFVLDYFLDQCINER